MNSTSINNRAARPRLAPLSTQELKLIGGTEMTTAALAGGAAGAGSGAGYAPMTTAEGLGGFALMMIDAIWVISILP